MNVGFHENYSNTLVDKKEIEDFSKVFPVKISNPLSSKMKFLRTSLLPGLLNAVSYNIKRKQNNFKLVSLILISTLYVAVNYFWLNFAYHVSFWVPYNNVLFLGQGSETIHRLNIYEVE